MILFTTFSGFYFFLLLLCVRGISRYQQGKQRIAYQLSLAVVIACWVFSTYITLFV